MSKSTPSTSTVVQSNPVGQLQAGYLGGLWDQAGNMGGKGGPETAYGFNYLDQLRNYAGNQATATQDQAGQMVPGGMGFISSALSGNAGNVLPAASQIAGLNNISGWAAGAGNTYGGAAASTGAQAPGIVAPYMSGLTGLAGQYGGLANAGYGSNAALQSIGNNALTASQGTASQLYGLAPQGMSAGWPSEQALMANSGMAINSNPAFSSGLMGLASGKYIDPSTNPALPGLINSALNPIARQFMTATAPQTDSGFESGGRYGSGAQTNMQTGNQLALGRAMDDATSSIVNNAYNQGLNTTLGAGQAVGGIYNTGMANSSSAAQAAGQLGQAGVGLTGNLIQGGGAALNTGYNTASNAYGTGASALNSLGGTGYGGMSSSLSGAANLGLAGNAQALSGYGTGGQLTNAGYGTGATALSQAGNLANAGDVTLGSIAQMTPNFANYPMSMDTAAFNSGWAPLQNYASMLGQPIGGNTVTDTTQSMSQNWGSQAIGGLLGLGSLAKMFGV